MPESIRRLFTSTPLESEEIIHLQRVLNTILSAFVIICCVLLVVVMVLFPQSAARPALSLGIILVVTISLLYINRRGKVRLASRLLIALLWLMAMLLSVTGGGVQVPAFGMFILPALLAFLLLGQCEGTVVIIVTVLAGSALLFLERRTDLLPPLMAASVEWIWITHTAVLIAAAWLFNVATRNLRQSLKHSRQQEHLLQAVIKSTTNGILVIDTEANVITANQRFFDLWKLPDNWQNLAGRETGLPMMAERTNNPQAFMARSRELLNDYSIEANDFIELKDGTVVQRHARPYVVDGAITGRIYTYLDVTEQIRTEQELVFYGEFKSLIASISAHFINLPIADIDAAITETLARVGQFVGADRSFVTLITGSPARVTTRYFWSDAGVEALEFDLPLEDFEQAFPWVMARLRQFEGVAVSQLDDLPIEAAAERETLWAAGIQSVLMAPLILNNTLIGYTGYDNVHQQKVWSENVAVLLRIMGEIFTNALERKRSEEALRASEEMFRSLTESAPVGIFMVDDNFRFIYANDQYYRILGYTPQELVGQDFRIVVPEENRATATETYRKRQQGVSLPQQYETRLLHKDGSSVWCEATAKAIRDSDGKIRTMGLIVDIRDRKQAEARQLELAVEREKVELLRQFIANVTHDLKTPLSVIDTSLYLLRRNDDPSRAAEKLNIIQEQTRILSDFIQDLLMISRLDYIPQLNFKPVHLDRLLDTALRQMRARIESKNLRAQIQRNGSIPAVLGAEDELSRAFGNLLENAINYTPDGGAILCELVQQDPYLVVTVTDTGIGIDRRDLPHIFERFYRSEQARSTLSTGSGLGLAIVKKVVDLHQGKIEIDSIPGHGTTFRVLLPVAPAAAASATPTHV
jgi:PAS domain S-box-containing protein